MEIKSSDVIHLENVSKHIATAPLPLSSKTLLTIAQSLSNALNLCIKYIDKEPVSKSPPPAAYLSKLSFSQYSSPRKAEVVVILSRMFQNFPRFNRTKILSNLYTPKQVNINCYLKNSL